MAYTPAITGIRTAIVGYIETAAPLARVHNGVRRIRNPGVWLKSMMSTSGATKDKVHAYEVTTLGTSSETPPGEPPGDITGRMHWRTHSMLIRGYYEHDDKQFGALECRSELAFGLELEQICHLIAVNNDLGGVAGVQALESDPIVTEFDTIEITTGRTGPTKSVHYAEITFGVIERARRLEA